MSFFSRHLYYACVIGLGSSSTGQLMAYYSPARDGLINIFHLSKSASDWFNVIAPLLAALGGPLAKPVLKLYGRRLSTFLFSLLYFVGWVLMSLTQPSFRWLLFIARSMQGLSVGATAGICSMYIVEISPSSHRGSYGVIHQLFVTLGGVYTFFLGIFCQWRLYTILCSLPTFIHLIFIWTCPDSRVIEEQTNGERLFQKKFIKQLLHSVACVLSQQLAGINAVFSNMTTIFEQAKVDLEPSVCSLITGFAQVISTAGATWCVEKFGRRPTWICSASGQLIALLMLWANELWQISNNLPILCLFFYIFSFGIGFGPIPWLIVPELFPDTVRGIAQGLASGLNWISAASVMFVWPFMADGIGNGWGFFVFAFVCLASLGYGVWLMPETRGKGMGYTPSNEI